MSTLSQVVDLISPFIAEDPDPSFKAFMEDRVVRALISARERSHGHVDVEDLRRKFHSESSATAFGSANHLMVRLGHDPFGEGARLREEGRANVRAHYGHPLGSAENPRVMGGVARSIASPRVGAAMPRKTAKAKKAVRHA